jgi:Cof subfamily protein (haloacid dehalogenase superfamily)
MAEDKICACQASMNMSSVILCFDMDGTLLDSQDAIHPADRAFLLHPPEGIQLVPSSGRTLASIHGIFQRHGLFQHQPLPFPLITQNGAACYLPGEQLVFQQAMSAETLARLYRLAQEQADVTSFFSSPARLFMLHPTEFGLAGAERYSYTIDPRDVNVFPSEPICKIMCFSANHERLLEIGAAAEGIPAEQAFSMATILEFTAPGANKGSGLCYLLAALGLTGATVLAAGDGENDLALFAQATRSFAPSTSPEMVRSSADVVIDPRQTGLFAPMLEEQEDQ